MADYGDGERRTFDTGNEKGRPNFESGAATADHIVDSPAKGLKNRGRRGVGLKFDTSAGRNIDAVAVSLDGRATSEAGRDDGRRRNHFADDEGLTGIRRTSCYLHRTVHGLGRPPVILRVDAAGPQQREQKTDGEERSDPVRPGHSKVPFFYQTQRKQTHHRHGALLRYPAL
ncbi:MAG: hypothetical protein RID42_11985 [Alphaproteobacteria bacterium]